eukprot:680266-Prorocentrum_minimum.AAC.1
MRRVGVDPWAGSVPVAGGDICALRSRGGGHRTYVLAGPPPRGRARARGQHEGTRDTALGAFHSAVGGRFTAPSGG